MFHVSLIGCSHFIAFTMWPIRTGIKKKGLFVLSFLFEPPQNTLNHCGVPRTVFSCISLSSEGEFGLITSNFIHSMHMQQHLYALATFCLKYDFYHFSGFLEGGFMVTEALLLVSLSLRKCFFHYIFCLRIKREMFSLLIILHNKIGSCKLTCFLLTAKM